MDIVFKAVSGILVVLVLCQIFSNQGKDISLLLTITVCCMIITAAVTYFRPILVFFKKLQASGNLDSEMIRIMLKVVGISLVTELTVMICADMSKASLGKCLQILSTAAILWLALPLFEQLLDLFNTVLGAI